jgi:PAS domain S-box-containing protein
MSRSKDGNFSTPCYENIVSNSSDLIVMVDREAVIHLANTALGEALGVAPSDLLGRGFAEFLDAERYETHVRPNLARALEGESFRYLTWLELPRIGRRYMSITHTPLQDHVGKIVAVGLTMRDITDMKEAELVLQRYAERLSLAATAGGIGVWERLVLRRRVVWDERMFAMHGVDRQGFVPNYERWKRLVHEDDREAFSHTMAESLRTGENFALRYRIRLPSGEVRHIQGEARVYEDETGRISRMVGINLDVTEQRRMQEFRDDIERITRHDLKSPLATAIGVSSLLAQEPNLTEEQRDLLLMVERAGRRMLDTINVSLDLYKMETGRFELAAEPMNLASIVAEVAEFVTAGQVARGVSVRFTGRPRCDDVCPTGVVGEARLLRAAFDNLLRNAVEASPDGAEVEVHFDCTRGCEVIIRNQGEVPEIVRGSFFEKYATAGKAGGTGLGTYSAKLMVEAQGGTLNMRTGNGETELVVFLPPGGAGAGLGGMPGPAAGAGGTSGRARPTPPATGPGDISD